MEFTVSVGTILTASSLLAAFGSLGGVIVWCVKFVERQKKQDRELATIRREQQLICYGVMACLRGLKEQGCDGPVTTALNKLEQHLNEAAHDEDF